MSQLQGLGGFPLLFFFFDRPIIAFWNVCLNCRELEWGVTHDSNPILRVVFNNMMGFRFERNECLYSNSSLTENKSRGAMRSRALLIAMAVEMRCITHDLYAMSMMHDNSITRYSKEIFLPTCACTYIIHGPCVPEVTI